MLDRLLGVETEYALRFTPAGAHPGNDRIYRAFEEVCGTLVKTRPGASGLGPPRFFTENGGAFCYEALPWSPEGGLIEGDTPECRSPGVLLRYQRAQDHLLDRARPLIEARLAAEGFPGSLGILKNCRDAQGHVYGAQENYEVEVATGAALWAYRAGLAALVPAVAVMVLVGWVLFVVLGIAALGALALALLAALAVPGLRPRVARWEDERRLTGGLGRALYLLETALVSPVVVPFAALLRACAFRRVRSEALAFLLSRPVLTGAGTLLQEGATERFVLSEKGPSIRRLMRFGVSPEDRPVFDTGNLLKALVRPLGLEWKELLGLFRRRQRLQLGLSDANPSQVAEYLKVGTTALVLDLCEAGRLADAPRLRDPLAALRAWIEDPELAATAETRAGPPLRALAVQRWYHARAKEHLAASPVVPMEAREVVRLWGEALDALERDPSAMVGRLDWVTKRYLLSTAGRGLSPEARKKLELRYHELGEGHLAALEQIGVAPTLVTREAIEQSLYEPPWDSPAALRGRLIRELSDPALKVVVSWQRVTVKEPGTRGRVIDLATYRRERQSPREPTER